MILAAIRSLLLDNATIAARVGTRVSVNRRLQGQALPAITIWHAGGGGRDHTHSGMTGLTETRLQVDIWAADGARSGAQEVAELGLAAVQALGGFRGTALGVVIGGIFVDGQRGSPEQQEANAPIVDRRSIDFTIWHQEG